MSTVSAKLYTNWPRTFEFRVRRSGVDAVEAFPSRNASVTRRSHMVSWMNSATASTVALERSGAGKGGRVAAIYRCIFDAVVDQRLPPGAKLAEEQLGSLFHASRTLVRSALQALAHDSIVTIERHRGAFVSAPTIADAQDIFFSRRLVESGIALEVARKIKPAEVEKLRTLLGDEAGALKRGDRRAA